MNSLKKYLGVIWLLMGPAIIFLLVSGAIKFIDHKGAKDIHNPVIWIIIISIFTPIAVGISIFGWYAIKGEYDQLPEKSAEVGD